LPSALERLLVEPSLLNEDEDDEEEKEELLLLVAFPKTSISDI
jgi:hypothetical protein